MVDVHGLVPVGGVVDRWYASSVEDGWEARLRARLLRTPGAGVGEAGLHFAKFTVPAGTPPACCAPATGGHAQAVADTARQASCACMAAATSAVSRGDRAAGASAASRADGVAAASGGGSVGEVAAGAARVSAASVAGSAGEVAAGAARVTVSGTGSAGEVAAGAARVTAAGSAGSAGEVAAGAARVTAAKGAGSASAGEVAAGAARSGAGRLHAGTTAGCCGVVGADSAGAGRRSVRPSSADKKQQERVFATQLRLARQLGRPISVHCVGKGSGARLAALLRAEGPVQAPCSIVLHAYGLGSGMVQQLLRAGGNVYFGVGGSVLSPRFKRVREAVHHIPLHRMLLESDAPDMLPRGVPLYALRIHRPPAAVPGRCGHEGAHVASAPSPSREDRDARWRRVREGMNEPAVIACVCRAIAVLRGDVHADTVAAVTSRNAQRVFLLRGQDTEARTSAVVRTELSASA